MLLYKNTFQNIKRLNCDFPIEDQFYADDNIAIIADGITRDPIGISDFSKYTKQEWLYKYPRPSGATLAAKVCCDEFKKATGTLKDKLIKSNKQIKKINDKYIKKCDYLENDYYGTVASCIRIDNYKLDYAYISDCGVIIYDKNGNIKFQTEDDHELYSTPYTRKLGMPWNLPETRVIVRRDYRNNLNNIKDGRCISYGALTGEESAVEFIREGQVDLEKNDTVILYSDGFKNYLHDEDFINHIIIFSKEEFEYYLDKKSNLNSDIYGEEKTIIIYKI